MKVIIKTSFITKFILVMSIFFAITTKITSKNNIQFDYTNFNGFRSLKTTNTWHEFTLHNNLNAKLKKKSAWTKLITLRNKKALQLKKIIMQWKGKHLDKIHASLYNKKETEALRPIEQNLICDGKWNTKKQQLIFNLNQKIISLNKFYLVLNYPNETEEIIKNGHFDLLKYNSIKFSKTKLNH